MTNEELQEIIDSKRNNLKSDRLDMSFGEIASMYSQDEIIIDPEYQRLFRWTQEQQSRFIESILLGIPIPPIFVAENKDGKWEVVDGLQRISTILSFMGILKNLPEKNNWKLKAGDLIKEIDGFGYTELTPKTQMTIKRFVCRIEILNWNSEIDIRYELFNRLNTGGTKLSDQEIRNCIFRGTDSYVNDYLKELANNEDFMNLTSLSETQIEQLYLEELVLRFTALYSSWDKITSSINSYMTDYMKDVVENKSLNTEEFKTIFYETLNILKPLSSKIFRFTHAGFSASLFDAIFVGVSKNLSKYKDSKELLIERIEELKNDKDFRDNTGSAASSQTRVRNRIKVALDIFGK